MSRRNILITGGAGFLGSHIALTLAQSNNVTVVDNFITSLGPDAPHVKTMKTYGIQIRSLDITSQQFFIWGRRMAEYESTRFHEIYNMACPASPPRYMALPVQTTMTCTVGVKNVLDLAKLHNAKVVHASTSEVYGDPTLTPQPEYYRGNVNSYGPRACYDEGKRVAEALCYDFNRSYGVDVRLARIFNTYGPHMDANDGRVVSNFICQALMNKPITIYGDGTQTRSFCYVDDLVGGLITLMNHNNNENVRQPINIGNPHEFTINQLADVVERVVSPHTKLIRIIKDLPEDDPMQRRPDITLAKSMLGFEPKIQLEEGVRRTSVWFSMLLCLNPEV